MASARSAALGGVPSQSLLWGIPGRHVFSGPCMQRSFIPAYFAWIASFSGTPRVCHCTLSQDVKRNTSHRTLPVLSLQAKDRGAIPKPDLAPNRLETPLNPRQRVTNTPSRKSLAQANPRSIRGARPCASQATLRSLSNLAWLACDDWEFGGSRISTLKPESVEATKGNR